MKYSHLAMKSEKNDLMTRLNSPEMVCPTWFLTLSSGDCYWPELWACLDPVKYALYVDEPYVTRSGKSKTRRRILAPHEVNVPTWEQRMIMLKEHPVMAVRVYHARIQALINKIILDGEQPLGEIIDYWMRIEFQDRGVLTSTLYSGLYCRTKNL